MPRRAFHMDKGPPRARDPASATRVSGGTLFALSASIKIVGTWDLSPGKGQIAEGATAIDDFEAERRAAAPAVAGPIRRAFEPVGVVFLPGEDVRLRSRALLKVGGDSARVHARQTGRTLAA
jgi:hypothetical protein